MRFSTSVVLAVGLLAALTHVDATEVQGQVTGETQHAEQVAVEAEAGQSLRSVVGDRLLGKPSKCTNMYQCAANSVRKPNRKCYNTQDDCDCLPGYYWDGRQCMEKMVVCVPLIGGKASPIGTIEFSDAGAAGVRIRGTLSGLSPGQHGWHIHQFGNTANGCASTGGHYNPKNSTHGAPSDVVRHAGDFGNLVADSNGVAIIDTTDTRSTIASIVGRAVVVHDNVDDLGKGGHVDSLKTGNAGGRFACGVIGLTL